MKTIMTGIWVLLAAGTCSCSSGGNVDIGDDHSASLGASLTDYAGSWEGYAEAYTFVDGTDRVRLNLDSVGSGSLELGNDAPALPAPDPESGPPGWPLMGNTPISPGLLVGYAFAISGGTIESKRIKLTTQTPAEYQQWCGLQTPVLDSSNSAGPAYWCVGGSGYHSDGTNCYLISNSGGPDVQQPCAKLSCIQLCSCTATSCTFNESRPLDLDAALESDGDKLVGTLVLNGERVTVRLEKL
ncbi:MAG TPA: hypothetical protein VG937_39905 [Polyangiaceae bacterium]|nr:hypothetical protein [Polyangiaceae bacterium]